MTEPIVVPGFEGLQRLLLEVARERTEEGVLKRIVEGACQDRPLVARACVWLTRDALPGAPHSPGAADDSLHLAASAWKTDEPPAEEWTHASGDYRLVPRGEALIGQIRADTNAFVDSPENWPGGYPDWARRDGVQSMVAEPIVFRDEFLGVIAVFASVSTKTPRTGPSLQEGVAWLRIFADHVASDIANTKAFEEIQELRRRLELENEYLREEVRQAHGFGEIIGSSKALQKCLHQVELVAPTDAAVLILGESGTGKELLARAIHDRSKRAQHPMIRVNCASVPRELFESEFFGHVRGAFTGALRDRRGRFELADRGTLFLDEVSEIPVELQAKLLRVLQEGTFERLGEERTRKVDVRILTASNRDLKEEVEAHRFREDLYYRISVFPIDLPALRERREDIPALAEHFLEQAAHRLGCARPRLKKKNVRRLQGYDWPGNIRELQNVIERGVITARSGHLLFELPLGEDDEEPFVAPSAVPPATGENDILTYEELKERERSNLARALERTGWKVHGPGGAAELLGLNPTTLSSKMKSLGLRRPAG